MITLHDIHISLGGHPVLRGVDLTLEQGKSLAVIGRSGSGKSVTMKAILGLITPDRGQITLNGAPIGPQRETFLDRFGMLFQGAALFDSLPIWENVAFRLLHNGTSRTQARDIAVAKLERVGLSAAQADQFPAELSGGMQKRAGLARAIACDPKVIFFDEPTTGLDPVMASTINDLIASVVAEDGVTALTITHDMTSVNKFADTLAFLDQGRIAWHGPQSTVADADYQPLQDFIAGRRTTP